MPGAPADIHWHTQEPSFGLAACFTQRETAALGFAMLKEGDVELPCQAAAVSKLFDFVS